MNVTHEPDPGFADGLERELRSTIRRQRRLDSGPSEISRSRAKSGWKVGLLAVAAMCLGSAGTFAVTGRIGNRTADLVIARYEALHEFARVRLSFFGEELQKAELTAASGQLSPEHLEYLRFEFSSLETQAAKEALNVAEVRTTGREPNDALSAPILDGRDFVTERLELDLAVLHRKAAMIDEQAAAFEPGSDEASAMDAEREAARAAEAIPTRRMSLRQEYLSGTLTAREVELADMSFSVEHDRERAARQVRERQRSLERVQTLYQSGMVDSFQMRSVELDLRSAQLQLRLADLELQILDRKLADPAAR